MIGDASRALHERALQVSPGGVHGAARFYPPQPIYFRKAEGQHLWDVDGRRYLDLHGAWGTAALGYNDPAVRRAVIEVLEHEGVLLGTPHEREIELSEMLADRIPCADLVALCGGGGSDPLYFGYRLARSVTRRSHLLKFEGEYHGWHDPLAVSVLPPLDRAGPEAQPVAVPVSDGAQEGSTDAIIGVLNDVDLLVRLFDEWGDQLACAVIEPVCHTSGCIPIDGEFLDTLRELCTHHGVVLMFDEILTGIRHGVHGAQSLVGVTPDLAAFGKALSNGFPISALVGSRELMEGLTPLGKALYSGTFCGHLVSVAAAIATIREMEERRVHDHTFRLTDRIKSSINQVAEDYEVEAVCQAFGSIFCVYFGTRRVRNYRDVAVRPAAQRLNDAYRSALLDAGVFMHPYLVNRSFVSAAHTEEDVDRIIEVIDGFMRAHRDEINAASGRAVVR
jgi:glutamate-1-semialdehyde 2,1-aminomutase